MNCRQCPRSCGVDRSNALGYCRAPQQPVIARAALHYWEEPCISGKEGSGAIFFSGCVMRCVFCQNSSISRNATGKTVSAKDLAEIMRRLEGEGANNINFVNPTHYVHAIISALEIYRPNIPIVYNSGGYESKETIRSLKGICDVYLPDYKYADDDLAMKFSNVRDYSTVAHEAISEMITQTGEPKYDKRGIILKGTIIRHLILPSHVINSIKVLKQIAKLPKTPVSIMAQYTPYNDLSSFPEIDRKLTQKELDRVINFANKLGIEGYIQSLESASSEFIPDFDGTGI